LATSGYPDSGQNWISIHLQLHFGGNGFKNVAFFAVGKSADIFQMQLPFFNRQQFPSLVRLHESSNSGCVYLTLD